MGTPTLYLPPLHDDTSINALLQSIGLHASSSIRQLSVSAEYHRIYATAIGRDHGEVVNKELVLRVAGNHIPRIKTVNEAGIIAWLSKNTSLPIPRVVRFDSSTNNVLDQEYILQERLPGKTLAEVYRDLSDQQMEYIIGQISDYLLEIASKPFHHVGGLYGGVAGDEQGEIRPGPPVEEHFWHSPDVAKFWPSSESFETLNISQPGYSTWSEYLIDRFKIHLHSIKAHPSLA